MNARTKEASIKDLMENAGMSRDQAEFAHAVNEGEIPGDLIEVDDDEASDS